MRITSLWQMDADNESALHEAMMNGEKDVAGDILNDIGDQETRVYLAEQYDLPLAECDEEWARRELKAQNDQP